MTWILCVPQMASTLLSDAQTHSVDWMCIVFLYIHNFFYYNFYFIYFFTLAILIVELNKTNQLSTWQNILYSLYFVSYFYYHYWHLISLYQYILCRNTVFTVLVNFGNFFTSKNHLNKVLEIPLRVREREREKWSMHL